MYEIDPQTGRMAGVTQRQSPFCEARSPEAVVDLLVVHGISLPPGVFGGDAIERLFTGRLDPGAHPYFREIHGLEVSAHLLIRRGGECVQFVSFDDCAWHAGESCYFGRNACNDFSIGIELEGVDDHPYAPAQYLRLAEVWGALNGRFPALRADRVVGHCDIAPGRKTDPGPAFDWPRLFGLLARQTV